MLLLENTSEGERGRDESACLGDVRVGERGREKEKERERERERVKESVCVCACMSSLQTSRVYRAALNRALHHDYYMAIVITTHKHGILNYTLCGFSDY